MKRGIINLGSIVLAGLIIAAFIVADKTAGTILIGLSVALAVFLLVISKEFRGRF